MKMFFLCDYQGPQLWVCYGVLENGFCFGQHICSHPAYAPGDLYFWRKERVEALEKIWGIKPEAAKDNCETIQVRSKEDVPQWFHDTQKQQDELKSHYDEYESLVGKIKAGVVLEMSDGTIVEHP